MGLPSGKSTTQRMSRVLMKAKKGECVDHINHNTLDNRKENLRLCTQSQNSMNRRLRKDNASGFKGVSWHKIIKKWVVYIRVDGSNKNLGYYDALEKAVHVYDAAAKEHQGEFALLNFPS